MGYDGLIYSVNTTTAALTAVSGYPSSVSNANAMAYSGGATPMIYFFSNSNAGSLVFQSSNPATSTFTPLSMTSGPTGTVNSACVGPGYKGYYCLDTHGYLYYYKFSSGNWTTVATVIKDQTGTDITATVASYSSGDMAFDGNGNLWLLLANSSTNKFGLYEIAGTVPTSNVGTVTAKQIVALGSSMPDGNDPVGIAFNATGQMYISTLNLSTFACDLYKWNSPTSTPVLVNSLSTVVLDLSSCSMPLSVLPVQFEQVTATADPKGEVSVRWTVNQQSNTRLYTIERSQDAQQWQPVGTVNSNGLANKQSYSFVDLHPFQGNSFYRVTETDWDQKQFFSYSVAVHLQVLQSVRVWPNPAKEVLYVESNQPDAVSAAVFDASGRDVLHIKLSPGLNKLSLAAIGSGVYILKTLQPAQSAGYTFIKQ